MGRVAKQATGAGMAEMLKTSRLQGLKDLGWCGSSIPCGEHSRSQAELAIPCVGKSSKGRWGAVRVIPAFHLERNLEKSTVMTLDEAFTI